MNPRTYLISELEPLLADVLELAFMLMLAIALVALVALVITVAVSTLLTSRSAAGEAPVEPAALPTDDVVVRIARYTHRQAGWVPHEEQSRSSRPATARQVPRPLPESPGRPTFVASDAPSRANLHP